MELEPGDACSSIAIRFTRPVPIYTPCLEPVALFLQSIVNSPPPDRRQEHHRYKPFNKFPDHVMRAGEWQDIYTSHRFNQADAQTGSEKLLWYKSVIGTTLPAAATTPPFETSDRLGGNLSHSGILPSGVHAPTDGRTG